MRLYEGNNFLFRILAIISTCIKGMFMIANEMAERRENPQKQVAVACKKNWTKDGTTTGNVKIVPFNAEKTISSFQTDKKTLVKPFLKWAGGKGQLLNAIRKYYPFEDGKITKYAEPFVGGGAVLFDVLSRYDLEAVYISDVNKELINTYRVIKTDVDTLVSFLENYQNEYISLNIDERKQYYLHKREIFNHLKISEDETKNVEKAALMIFLNKTCFNGLYRVNRKGLFNVPMGSYKNPMICDEKNLLAISGKLKNVEIVCQDYQASADFIDDKTFVYFDPPYRPLTETASFTAYTENLFSDAEQIKLAKFVDAMDKKKAKILVSNSDPKNSNTDDDFFDEIYQGHKIKRIEALRMINCNSEARGKIKELLISNV